MTVIAYCGKYLAADRQASYAGTPFATTKLFILDEYSAVAFTGVMYLSGEMLKWFKSGRKPRKFPQNSSPDGFIKALYVENGELFIYEDSPYPIKVEQPYFALGSGRDFALSQLLVGHDAIRAVEVANEGSIECGLGIDVYEVVLKTEKKSKKKK